MYNKLTKKELIELLEVERIKKNKHKEKAIKTATKWLQDNQAARLFSSCRNNAKIKNTEFSLTRDDIIIPEVCPILGITLTNISEQGRVFSNASVDRIDSTKGYHKDNIIIMSDLANRMKQNATQEQLIAFAEGVLKFYGRTTDI